MSDDLTIGTQYDVTLDDCCIQGTFRSTLTQRVLRRDVDGYDDDDDDVHSLTFDNGVTLTMFDQVKFEEVNV